MGSLPAPVLGGAVVVIVTPYTNGMGRDRHRPPTIEGMASDEDENKDAPSAEIVDFVAERAPELDPADVSRFMAQHAKPADEPESHVAWAVRVMRETGEGEVGKGLPVDRVVSEIRRMDR